MKALSSHQGRTLSIIRHGGGFAGEYHITLHGGLIKSANALVRKGVAGIAMVDEGHGPYKVWNIVNEPPTIALPDFREWYMRCAIHGIKDQRISKMFNWYYRDSDQKFHDYFRAMVSPGDAVDLFFGFKVTH